MIKLALYFFVIASLTNGVFSQTKAGAQKSLIVDDAIFYNDVNNWFRAWELVSKNVFKLDGFQTVDFVFFDDKYVYSTSTTTIHKGEEVKAPKLFNRQFVWQRALHNGLLTLPDQQVIPVGLMSFASELKDKKSNSFFVMPLSSFWEKAGVTSTELELQKLITGVFLHEFSHSQQMQNFGRKMTEYEKTNSFKGDFSDNIVQNLFSKNSAYVDAYTLEVNTFFEAEFTKNGTTKNGLIKKGIDLMKSRHTQYFKDNYKNLSQIDEFFLTMEGLGQFTMYAWLTNPKGGNIPSEIAVKGVRRGGKWWSQDEGFALFLLLTNYQEPTQWAKPLFGTETTSVIELLQESIAKQ